MCGINGIYNFSHRQLHDGELLIKKMNKAIAHRGPDDTGVWSDAESGIYLGHQRLSILDPSSNGHQPMHSSGCISIVYNGEFYNFKKIKFSKFADTFFSSETDTEVILKFFKGQKDDCLSDINGMFAMVIWSSENKELFLARDRIGIKPLYYTNTNGVFAFSLEIKALLTLPWKQAELDEEDLYHFLTFNKVFPPKTMFRNIYKFHPGYKMIVGSEGIKSYEEYWKIEYKDYSSWTESKIQDKIYEELNKSVKRRLVSDVPVGAFLSGGVDSSAIVSLVESNTSSQIKTYSIGFDNSPNYDELVYARKISKQFNTEHIEKIVTPKDIIELLPKMAEIFDEPLADVTSIPIYFISQLAYKTGTKVVLTGDGADELFCGYRNWMRYVKLSTLFQIFSALPKPLKLLAANIYGQIEPESTKHEILLRAANKQEFFWGSAGGIKENAKNSFLSSDYKKRMFEMNSHDNVIQYRQKFNKLMNAGKRKYGNIDWMTFIGLIQIIPNYYLYRADHVGMANSVEIRVPFLDHNFVNLALSIPGRHKISNNIPKNILKKTFENYLPHEILYRNKQGFCVPIQEWASDTILCYIEDKLSCFCNDTGFFNERGIKKHIRAAKEGRTDKTFGLWNIYFLMAWFYKWIL